MSLENLNENIARLDDTQFAQLWNDLSKFIDEDPIERFFKAPGFLNLEPTPAQEVILKRIYGKPLDNKLARRVDFETTDGEGGFALEQRLMTEVEIYEFLTSQTYNPVADQNRKIKDIDLICGRRSGKTTLAAAIALYTTISNNWKPYLKKKRFATVLILSYDRDFSEEIIDLLKFMIEESPTLSRMLNTKAKNTANAVRVRVPWIVDNYVEYSHVQIKVSTANTKAGRGTAACAVLCDEIAFWNIAENLKETDEKIIKAVRPSMKQFGDKAIMLKLSSPGIRQGVLYNEYDRYNRGELPGSFEVFKAPTWVMNRIMTVDQYKDEIKLDPDGFDTEFRSNFTDSLRNWISPEFIDASILRGVKFNPPEEEKRLETKYRAAIDAAFKSDRFTFSVTAVVDNRVKQFVSMGWKGSKKEPVSTFAVAEYIKNVCKEFGIDTVAADQFAFQPLKEVFNAYNMTLEEYTFTPVFKKKIYMNLKTLIHSQQIDLLDNDIQTKELKELVVEQSNAGMIKISHPTGGTDDFADSLAISAFLAVKEIGSGKFEFQAASPFGNYDIPIDIKTGRSFGAPSISLLSISGHLPEAVSDNTALFRKDPKTGKLILEDSEEEEADDESHFLF